MLPSRVGLLFGVFAIIISNVLITSYLLPYPSPYTLGYSSRVPYSWLLTPFFDYPEIEKWHSKVYERVIGVRTLSGQHYPVMWPYPIDIVYTWVNGSDPRQQAGIFFCCDSLPFSSFVEDETRNLTSEEFFRSVLFC